ncbi:hypothetical protein [Aeribacillus alveayuensis]|uniref:ABC transporter permease n=1 Tax=Aeribacillus alveayuensis TaxID=279215 RepID=A0ABT9VSU6_9BACI|nr:hypothetical protein [Bacillus alveayuensis]
MLLFRQLKTWIYWKAKVRWLQNWGNFKMFNLNNKLIIPFITLGFKIIGILLVFGLGFGGAFLFNKYISSNPYSFWQIVFFLFIFVEGISNGLATGRWISSSKEESWLLASTPIGSIKYILFLWIDESLWMLRNSFFSNIAGIIGALLVFPVKITYLVIAFFIVIIFYFLISLCTTLIQYYIIKKSVYLKGKGLISNLLIPLLLVPIIYLLTKILTPWLLTFPVVSESENILTDYITWIEDGLDILLSSGELVLSLVNQWYYPYSLLAELMVNGSFFIPIIGSFLYILFLLLVALFLLNVISRKDNVTNMDNSKFDDKVTKFFILVSKCILNKKLKERHVQYYLISLLKNYLAKRNLFVVLGSSLWPIITFIFTFIYFSPNYLSERFVLAFSILITVYFPFHVVNSIYTKLKMKLSFDNEGSFLQVLIAYGASPEYLYDLKTKVVRVLSLPGYFYVTVVTFIFMPIPIFIKVGLFILSIISYIVITKFVLLHSVLVPHYEFYNLSQIGKYPDQIKMKNSINTLIISITLPIIPVTMYLLKDIQESLLIFFSTLWILVGLGIGYFFLSRILKKRFTYFDIEEISINRTYIVNALFWKERLILIIFTIAIYITGAILSIFREFVVAEILVLIPVIIIQLILISSYNQKRKIENKRNITIN